MDVTICDSCGVMDRGYPLCPTCNARVNGPAVEAFDEGFAEYEAAEVPATKSRKK